MNDVARSISPFGFPMLVDDEGVAEVGFLSRNALRATASDFAVIRQRALRDIALGKIAGRWRIGAADPTALVPGDVPMVRALAVANRMQLLSETLDILERAESLPSVDVEQEENFRSSRKMVDAWVHDATRIQTAVPFFIPAATAVALMESDPPAGDVLEQLRLPFDAVLVVFGAELRFESGELFAAEERKIAPDRIAERVDRGQFKTLLSDIVQRGGAITGVVFYAGDGGVGLADEIVWLVSGEPEDANPLDRPREFYTGSLESATLAPAIANLAAAVAWG